MLGFHTRQCFTTMNEAPCCNPISYNMPSRVSVAGGHHKLGFLSDPMLNHQEVKYYRKLAAEGGGGKSAGLYITMSLLPKIIYQVPTMFQKMDSVVNLQSIYHISISPVLLNHRQCSLPLCICVYVYLFCAIHYVYSYCMSTFLKSAP